MAIYIIMAIIIHIAHLVVETYLLHARSANTMLSLHHMLKKNLSDSQKRESALHVHYFTLENLNGGCCYLMDNNISLMYDANVLLNPLQLR